MPADSTSHRPKRPFQPSITSFFARAEASASDFFSPPASSSSGSHATTHAPPSLPASVQTSLLNVGMRVRKSVPEGYKTHKLGQHQFAAGEGVVHVYNSANGVPAPAAPTEQPHARELLPFCGLLKIGGFATQPMPTYYSSGGSGSGSGYGYGHGYNDEASYSHPITAYPHPFHPAPFSIPFLSSQSSTTSTLSADSAPARNPNPHKRSHADIEDDAVFFPVLPSSSFALDEDVPISPLTTTPPPPSTTSHSHSIINPLRPFAQPRTRSMRKLQVLNGVDSLQKGHDMDIEIENTESGDGLGMGDARGGGSGRQSSDFEEADFLRPWEDEVEMGGV